MRRRTPRSTGSSTERMQELARPGRLVEGRIQGALCREDGRPVYAIVVTAAEEERVRRVAERDGQCLEEALRRIRERADSERDRYLRSSTASTRIASAPDLTVDSTHLPPAGRRRRDHGYVQSRPPGETRRRPAPRRRSRGRPRRRTSRRGRVPPRSTSHGAPRPTRSPPGRATSLGLSLAGHAGTLDPNVSGLLWVGVGPALKLLPLVLEFPKRYIAAVNFHAPVPRRDLDRLVGRVHRAGLPDPARYARP